MNHTIIFPDAGTIFYEYDAFSNITKQTDANGNSYEMQYDIAGRITQKSGPDGTTNYDYDTAPYGKGMLASETYNENTKTYNYDNLSRLLSISETFEGEEYTWFYEYDNFGRISKTTYPNGFAYTKHYKTNGSLEQIKRADNGALILKTENVNAYGQVTQLPRGWKLAGYIGVGALAGALTSGVSAGVSSVLAGGSFGAGFVGSSAAAVAPTSFINGAVIGTATGFTSGFITGTGTGLLEGQSLGQSSVQGLKYGGIGVPLPVLY
ncbi:MAG: hypothetical protein GXO80_01425 [Chlorobi bacterium]|nr:hypothetical protein [Chlorobiota bacterium]